MFLAARLLAHVEASVHLRLVDPPFPSVFLLSPPGLSR
jgi:hypothetical protein